jgi:uncharacterized protein YcsI (UPF0317 family)
MKDDTLLESQRVRRDIRAGRYTGNSRGLAPGYVHCNIAIMPKAFAFDFMLYCQRNQRACPVLEVTDPGDPEPRKLAPGADLRTDLSRYSVFIDGERQDDVDDISHLWRDDLVSFLIGSGITFDDAFERAGVPTHRDRWVVRTTLPTEPAGPFRGDLIATMRWLTPQQAITAVQVSSRFPFNHGAPIHIGDPAAIGTDLKNPMFGGSVPERPAHLTSVFWACGVTPQSAAEAAKLPLFIVHAAAHGFISDLRADSLMI